MKGVPLKAHLSVSVDVFREHDHEIVAATSGEFAVPGLGRCRIWGRDGHALRCNSPLAKPELVVVRVDPVSSTCPDEDVGPQKPAYGFPYAWQRGGNFAVEGGITPVVPSYLSFWYFNDRVNICPGTPLSFSFPQFVENVRSDFTIDDFQLDNYRQLTFSANGITAADGIRLGLPAPPR